MSNIVDFKQAAAQLHTKVRLNKLIEAGLTIRDLAIIYLATNRVFGGNVRALEQLAEMGPENLKYLKVTTYDDDAGNVYTFGDDDRTVLVYTISHSHLTFDWHEPGAEGFNLAGIENPGHVVQRIMLEKFDLLGFTSFSALGLFALSAFFFSCVSEFNPIHLQYFDESKRIGLVLHDPKRGIDIALVTDLQLWKCTEEDSTRELS
jgi:hypothetical protein